MNVQGISVVIPNYNGVQLFQEVLPTVLQALKNIGLPYEIIVSDDCSADGSVQYLKENFPAINVLVNEQNSGFSVTINKGIFAAKHSHLLLLNSDVKLSSDYFAHLLRYFDKEDTFGVMTRIIGWNDELIQDGGKYPSFHGVKIKTSGNYIPEETKPSQMLYSMYLSGANAFVSREKINVLRGFNEIFSPFYVEDFELSLRAWRLGWKCYYDHGTYCRHKLSATIKSTNRKKAIQVIYNRNKMFLHAIHLTQGKRFLWFLQLIPESLVHFFTLRWSYFHSLYLFILSYGKVIQSRRSFHQLANQKALLEVSAVASFITDSLSDEKIRRF